MSNDNNSKNSQKYNTKEIPSKYNPHGLEKKWYPLWEKKNFFSWKNHQDYSELNNSIEEAEKRKQDKKTFSIVIPPPNVTGSLHLGHALNHTIQDILTRYHRMKNDVTMWLPGTDHAGIATQNVVEKLLSKENKNRWDLGREKFEERVWQWKEESGGIITHQQRQLGESVDWDYERFTMDDGLSKTVKDVFVSLYNEKLIYQGERIINWCPHCVTAISNIEVEYSERKGKLYYFHYVVLGDTDHKENIKIDEADIQKAINNKSILTVATTRPETMLGDEALAVNPNDERYASFIGKTAIIPLINKAIPIIADDFVDKEFGTGVVKVTPAHDPNDFEIGVRHNLPITRILDDHGRTNELAGPYKNLSREKARDQVVSDLEKQSILEKTEDIKHAVGECYRCQTIVEPITSKQWFVDVKPLAKKAIEVVKDGSIEFFPKRWENTYFEWMYNIQDWCISRQLWWGHRIPAYTCEDCGHLQVATEHPNGCEKCKSPKMNQDSDVLDTWFSSALWPFSTFMDSGKNDAMNNGVNDASNKNDVTNKEQTNNNASVVKWPASNTELSLFYPTSVLVTGFDIIFFWVARMIMMGKHFMKEIPFEKVYIHGLVRDAERKKMSKSKGNVVNPLEKMDEYGTDAFRFFMVSILPEGKDIIYDESRLKGYSAFCNKIWNTARFIWMNQPEDYQIPEKPPTELSSIDNWIIKEFNDCLDKVDDALNSMRFSDYAQAIYDFIWKNFCDNYLELAKTSLKEEKTSETTLYVLNTIFTNALKILHPVMPFITEELYSFWSNNEDKEKNEKNEGDNKADDDYVIVSSWPQKIDQTDKDGWQNTEKVLHLIYKIRNIRSELQIAPGEKFAASVTAANTKDSEVFKEQSSHIENLARLSKFSVLESNQETNEVNNSDAKGIKVEFDFGTLHLDIEDLFDKDKEVSRLTKEIDNIEKYVNSLEKKLANSEFVKKAPPELIEAEKTKQENAKEKLTAMHEQLEILS